MSSKTIYWLQWSLVKEDKAYPPKIYATKAAWEEAYKYMMEMTNKYKDVRKWTTR